MLLSKQKGSIDLFFTRGRPNKIDLYYISQSYFHPRKNTIRNNSKTFILFQPTLRDIILLFHDIAGLDMTLEEWKQFCRKAWENDYDYLQIDRFAKKGEGRYTITNCNKKTFIEATPETEPFYFFYINMIYSTKNKDELKDWEELDDLQSEVKQIRLVENLGKQWFHYDVTELFEPHTK